MLIDEVQICIGFEKTINGLHATEKYDIYITGSNEFLLSSDLATLFMGRTFEIKVYPFSFSEYMQYSAFADKYAAFDKYLIEGGMSGSYLYKDQEAKKRQTISLSVHICSIFAMLLLFTEFADMTSGEKNIFPLTINII